MTRPTKDDPLDGRVASREALLNLALHIHMEWGPELMRAEDERLQERCRGLDASEAAGIIAEAQAAASLGYRIVYDDWDEARASELQAAARAAVEAAHPWVDEDNMSHLLSQAAYYAWHG